MAITDPHTEYTLWAPRWQRARDAVAGGDAIRLIAALGATSAGVRGTLPGLATSQTRALSDLEAYVPRLRDESDARYSARLARGLWYDATARTLDAWLGALFRKPSHLTIPDPIKLHAENITLSGTPYESLRQKVASELLTVGRHGIWQDYNTTFKRPYWVTYTAEQILSWSPWLRPDGTITLGQVILAEAVEVPNLDGFGGILTPRIRVLELDAAGHYLVRIFEANSDTNAMEETEQSQPNIGGIPFTEIPFELFGPSAIGWEMQRAPLLPVADVNLDHFRLDVDYKEALHVNAIATLFIVGGDPEKQTWELGAGVVHCLPVGGEATFASGGAQAGPIKDEKLADEDRMAMLGARLLQRPKRAAETAEALTIQASGETASLKAVATTLTQVLTRCWKRHVRWLGGNPEGIGDTLSTDFAVVRLSPAELQQQFQLVVAGELSRETFLENLYEGEILRHDATEELRRIEAERARTAATDPALVAEGQAALATLKTALLAGDGAGMSAAVNQLEAVFADAALQGRPQADPFSRARGDALPQPTA